MIKGLALSAIASSVVMAGGYKIPEQSLNSMALGAAYVAHTTGADTAYYNPANMVFIDEGKSYVEGGITLAHLPSNVFSSAPEYSGESEVENILIPYFHYIAPAMGNFRWGVSLTVPGGLTKRWETPFQKAFAEEFTLKVVEFNPSLSYRIRDDFSIGGGLRLVYSEGVIKNDSAVATTDMEGDTVGLGYNLAMTYKPTSEMNFAVTYRSSIDLDEEGTATLYSGDTLLYDGDASVSVPLPAALNVAISKTWQDTFTLELLYERTYWSQYETLKFEGVPLPEAPKNWKDTDTFRVGATIKMDNKITAMMGFAIDETPVPENTIGFELPDSDAKIFSMGFRYQQREDLSWGAAFLYDSKESRTINGFGTFHEGGAFLTTIGIAYEY
ncbi:hypothetical protein TSL6_15720 [Sulfurovum sp. TSL6]|uniref:OmpP1/FadL family transporter n=1 Tax=Sulfurovum sp. TSL6 TaxID=2826995 RepID=UPI001CC6CF01|nr:outer membrane protein transport protein [Sulfurovum sp. TSL6]GIU01066.1 hypothetical protein TSL6_15720 [Sulfurovum sp. TSL6]